MSEISLATDPAYLGDAPVSGGVVSPSVEVNTRAGNWPRMIVLDEETRTRLKTWIDEELDAFYLERGPMMEDWKRYQTIYWAAPATKEKNFPFKRAANIVIPLAAMAVESVHARFMNTLFAVEPFWSIRAKSKEWMDLDKPFEEYLQSEAESAEALDVFGFCNSWLMEYVKLGTAVVKSGYEKIIKKSLRKRGDSEEEFFFTVRNGATLERVPLGNYIQRFSELDPQTAPLCGERHEFTWAQLKRMAQSGRMNSDAIEKIKHRWTEIRQPVSVSDENSNQTELERLAHAEPKWTATFKVYELWCSFDVDGDGWDEEIVIDYERDSGEFLSIRYNWYDDLHRPYRIATYIPIEGIWVGLGVCKKTEQFQEEATTIHRQRLDNATLANMAQIVIKRGLGYGDGEPLFPGKMWFVDNVQTDIKEFKLSEVYNSSYANEESVVRYWEKSVGINELNLGIPHEGTPAPATSDLTRLAEGNKRFDLSLKSVKRCLSLAGQDVVTNIQLFGNQQIHYWIVGDDAPKVEKVINMPSILIRRGAVITLTVTDSITNQDVEQRQWLTLFQVLTGYYEKILMLAQLIAQVSGDPTILIGGAQRALMASDAVMRGLLERFKIPDADEFSLAGGSNGNGNGPASNGNAGALPPPRPAIGPGGGGSTGASENTSLTGV